MNEDEMLKGREAQIREQRGVGLIGGTMAALGSERTAQPHPREVLLADLNDQEQRLLDKLHALREMRQEICCLPREEAERLMRIARLTERASGQPRNF